MAAPAGMYAASVTLICLQILTGVWSTTIQVKNKCTYPVSPAIAGSILPSTTGFTLQPEESMTISVPPVWNGVIWGRTFCRVDEATATFSCLTGDCRSGTVECAGNTATPPVTIVEFTLNGPGEQDMVVVTVEEGFNVPVIVEAAVDDGSEWRGCAMNLNDVCPAELRVTAGTETMACSKPHRNNCSMLSAVFKNYCSRIRVCPEEASSSLEQPPPETSTRYILLTYCPVNITTSSSASGNASWIKSTMKNISMAVIGVVVLSVLSVVACGVTITIQITRR